MKRGPVIAEIAAWTLFFPIAIVLMIRRKLGYGYETAEGRGDLRVRLDVAREGVVERKRAFRWASAWASLLLTVGWIMVLPQRIVAPILGLFDAPRTWFAALYSDDAERWLVVGGMIGVGLLLIDRGIRVYAPVREATAG